MKKKNPYNNSSDIVVEVDPQCARDCKFCDRMAYATRHPYCTYPFGREFIKGVCQHKRAK